MDRLHMGGTFLQQVPTVTVGGLPVAIRQGGSIGGLGSALSSVTSAVQAAGDIASLVQNPMALVESAVGDAISAATSELSSVTGQLTGGQFSSLSSALNQVNFALSDFQAHTSNLSGLSASISEIVPDFNKLTDLGNNLTSLGSDTRDNFIQSTASALFSDTQLNDIKDTINVTVLNKFNLIKREDANTPAGQAAIASHVTDITNLLNNQKNTMETIVSADVNNFNESSNNLTYSTSVIGLAEQFSNTDSVSYTLLNRVGKPTTISAFNDAIESSKQE